MNENKSQKKDNYVSQHNFPQEKGLLLKSQKVISVSDRRFRAVESEKRGLTRDQEKMEWEAGVNKT